MYLSILCFHVHLQRNSVSPTTTTHPSIELHQVVKIEYCFAVRYNLIYIRSPRLLSISDACLLVAASDILKRFFWTHVSSHHECIINWPIINSSTKSSRQDKHLHFGTRLIADTHWMYSCWTRMQPLKVGTSKAKKNNMCV